MREYVTMLAIYMAALTPIFALASLAYAKICRKERKKSYHWIVGLFGAYISFLLSFTLLQNGTQPLPRKSVIEQALYRIESGMMINLVPFRTIKAYFDAAGELFSINILGNVLIFSPLGFMLPIISRKINRLWKVTACAASISLSIEILQLFVGRSTDIDDLILNTAGGTIGYAAYAFFKKVIR